MDERLKQRLVGAAVLGTVLVIFVPMVLDQRPAPPDVIEDSPLPPAPERRFQSRVVPLGEEGIPTPVAEPPEDGGAEAVSEAPPDAPAQAPEGGGTPATAPAAGAEVADPPADGDEGGGPPGDQRVGLKAWAVQLGSFADRDNALALRDRLREAGFTAFVETASVNERPMTRVFVGPELLRENALKTQGRLEKDLDLKEGQVVRYPRG